jgi:hypothetical protein
MLAEIFMVRLEATARVSQETMSSNSRFVPINPAGPLELKKARPNPNERTKALLVPVAFGSVQT